MNKVEWNHNRIDRLLIESGIRVKAVRRHILTALFHFGHPVSHSQLSMAGTVGSYNRVTVYRTLKTLQEGGLVHAVRGTDGVTRFCAHPPAERGCPGNHLHFVCEHCGKMVCLTGQKMPRVEVPIEYKVEGKQFLVFGVCKECNSIE